MFGGARIFCTKFSPVVQIGVLNITFIFVRNERKNGALVLGSQTCNWELTVIFIYLN